MLGYLQVRDDRRPGTRGGISPDYKNQPVAWTCINPYICRTTFLRPLRPVLEKDHASLESNRIVSLANVGEDETEVHLTN